MATVFRAFFPGPPRFYETGPESRKNRLFKDHGNRPVYGNKLFKASDRIRAFYGVFRKWPDWQSGHFAGFSGSQTPCEHGGFAGGILIPRLTCTVFPEGGLT